MKEENQRKPFVFQTPKPRNLNPKFPNNVIKPKRLTPEFPKENTPKPKNQNGFKNPKQFNKK